MPLPIVFAGPTLHGLDRRSVSEVLAQLFFDCTSTCFQEHRGIDFFDFVQSIGAGPLASWAKAATEAPCVTKSAPPAASYKPVAPYLLPLPEYRVSAEMTERVAKAAVASSLAWENAGDNN